jgi:hypothetical protein
MLERSILTVVKNVAFFKNSNLTDLTLEHSLLIVLNHVVIVSKESTLNR